MTTSCLLWARMTSHVFSMAERKKNKKQRKVGLEHDAGEQGYQQAHHAIAPGREDERAQPRGARHGEEVDDEGDVLRWTTLPTSM